MSEQSGSLAQLSHEQRVRLENSLLDGVASSETGNVPRQASSEAPLTAAQWRLWYLAQLDPESPAYNQLQVIQLSGSLDAAALQRSIDTLSARHDSLRLSICSRNELPVQMCGALLPYKISTLKLAQSTITEQEDTAWRACAQWQEQLFEMSEAPLWRIRLIKFNDTKHWLVRTCHHIISDGWSNRLYWQELAHAYNAFTKDESPVFQPLRTSYIDFAVWQKQWLDSESTHLLESYWSQRLAGLERLELPTDHPRKPQAKASGRIYSFSLPSELAEAIGSLARAQNASNYMVLLSAFQVLLHSYTRQNDIAIGSPVANRTLPETEGIYGLFANTLVMRADCANDPEFAKLLEQTKKHTLDAIDHQALPFEKLVEILNPKRDATRNPLFDVLFAVQNMPANEWSLPELGCQRLTPPGLTVKFDLSLVVYESAARMTCQIEYASALYDKESIEGMGRLFSKVLRGCLLYTSPSPRDATLSRMPSSA